MVNVLVIGSGGREHAICWKLAQSKEVEHIFVSPGSYGISTVEKVENTTLDLKDFKSVCTWAKEKCIKTVIVGPEDPLAKGIADALNACGISCFGPTALAARIESDKKWSKDLMVKYGIPTAKYSSFTDAKEAKEFINSAGYDTLVVKASGLAAGKGVVVAADKFQACQAVDTILTEHKYGDAGETIVVEELLEGVELSVLGFSDGKTVLPMLPAQDHKRALDNDRGSNTGGMGAYCPTPFIDDKGIEWVKENILQKAVDGLKEEKCPFVGVLYAGLMMTKDGPKVLEFNCRFGDPETEVILPLLETDLYELVKSCCEGTLDKIQLKWKENLSAVGVVMSSRGYPESSSKGDVIKGLETVGKTPGMIVFHSGIAKKDEDLVTNGGRVLINVCLAPSLVTAAAKATQACSQVSFPGSHHRKDIALKGISSWILSKGKMSYKSSGVDISAGNSLVKSIKPLVKKTSKSGVLTDLGGFGSLYSTKLAGHVHPILVAGADGIGTKLMIAQSMGKHSTVGIDLVAMCVNDILCHGAEPLFFLDYFACGKLDINTASSVIEGIAEGCAIAGCSLVGGETAEMPDMYEEGVYDAAGFAVGAVEEGQELPHMNRILHGDVVFGLPSSGLHSNGFSLARKVLSKIGMDFNQKAPFSDKTIGEELLTPTKIYVKDVLPLVREHNIRGVAHITGGGLLENIPRILPENMKVVLDASAWEIPKIFPWLAVNGEISEEEMLKTFNCGIGLIIISGFEKKNEVKHKLGVEIIGEVKKRKEGEPQVEVKDFAPIFGSLMKPFIPEVIERVVNKKRIAVLISGTGSNLQALIESMNGGFINGEIVVVISNKAEVFGLTKAEEAGIPTKVIPHGNFSSREEFEKEMQKELESRGVELVVLAGFMRVLTRWFVSRWRGKLVNIHPALLPLFKGTNAHQQALDAGVRLTGCSVHFVEVDIDAGAIIVQEAVPIETDDTVKTIQKRVLKAEHRALPKAVQMICSGKLELDLETGKIIWK